MKMPLETALSVGSETLTVKQGRKNEFRPFLYAKKEKNSRNGVLL